MMTRNGMVPPTTMTARWLAWAAWLPLACSGGDDGRGSASEGSATMTTTGGTATTDGSGSGSGTATDTSGSGSMSASSSSSSDPSGASETMTSDPSTSGTSTGTSTTGEPTTSTSGGSTTSDTTTGGVDCSEMGMGMGEPLSVIWIANSGQGTVSKIDTKTGQELGRYITRPDGAGSPSRTSVNRFGDVAVANRNGGVTKVIARAENCPDKNNDGVITTSKGANDILAWGQDECVAWHTPLAHGDNRPVAWTSGVQNMQTCEWEDVNVWTAWSDWAPGSAVVALLDGDDGTVLKEVPIPDLPQPWPGWHGFYGAAVDADNNVWLSQLQGSMPQPAWLVRVKMSDFTYKGFPVPGDGGYGMTVTSEGYVWLCGLQTRRFNPMTEAWTSVPLLNGSVHTGGCMGDGDGILYRGSYAQIHGINTTTLETVKTLNVGQPGDDYIWGVAVDFEGKVWGVPRNGSRAYKVNPDTGVIELLVQGLVQAYTYSDMTGFALEKVINPG